MKVLSLILAAGLLLSGCASFQRSEVIETDKLDGYASGEYRDNSGGPTGTISAAGGGGASAGWGMGAIALKTGPPPSGADKFAKAIAMINYSKKLKSIKYDEAGGIVSYEFDHQQPLSMQSSKLTPPARQATLPPAFGYQPVE